ncbi:MAG: four helix bundle protein [Bacteroidales bacterium]|nr:four helix bundle protein [Bacteroidales bacterium]
MENKLVHARTFKGLEVYKQARSLVKSIFDLTKDFPVEEKYSLTDQIRRYSRAIEAQIAESWGKRRYEKYFVLKLTDSDAEQYETQHWLEVAFENTNILKKTKDDFISQCESIEKMLNSMINKSSKFCKN